MKKYQVRMNCIEFVDLVILAKNKDRARKLAEKYASCPQGDMEFCEFLPVDNWDTIDYE